MIKEFELIFERAEAVSTIMQRVKVHVPASKDWLFHHFWQPLGEESLNQLYQACDADDVGQALRLMRPVVLAHCLLGDLSKKASLEDITDTMSRFADFSIKKSLAFLERSYAERFGIPLGKENGAPQKLHVIALGKLGGYELNVSSDIDLVFAYPEEGQSNGRRVLDNADYFCRLARDLARFMNEENEFGFVFRVDTRLRPWGDAGLLAQNFAMIEQYLFGIAREWERFAWIKSRAITGDQTEDLFSFVRPFIFRRYFDFSAFSSIRDLKRKIHNEAQKKNGDDIKVGYGGIREIEFIAQSFQIIRGGRLPELQVRPTRKVLALIGKLGFLPADVIRDLDEAYVFLRKLEHALQYLNDQQTQKIPASSEARKKVADIMDCPNWETLVSQLAFTRDRVAQLFDLVFEAPHLKEEQIFEVEPSWLEDRLNEYGYHHPKDSTTKMIPLLQSSWLKHLNPTTLNDFFTLCNRAIGVCATFSDPDSVLFRLLKFLTTIAGRHTYLQLLLEYPQALQQVVKLCAKSPWVADYLGQHPVLLDELLDPRSLLVPIDWQEGVRTLQQQLANASPDEAMDIFREFKHRMVIHILARDLNGIFSALEVGDELSRLADIILHLALSFCWQALKRKHCEIPRFAIVAFGKLGAKELGYGSDLDLVFIYDDPDPQAPLDYARLAQRLNGFLTSHTVSGVLYETDLRLRPDGASGLLVSSLESFYEYQKRRAWPWEHQALTRARYVAGDAKIGAYFERLRREILRQKRDRKRLAQDVLAMRHKMRAYHQSHIPSDCLDLKRSPGGLIDAEFVVQFLILAHTAAHSYFAENIGTFALLHRFAHRRFLSYSLAAEAAVALVGLRRMQHELFLQEKPDLIQKTAENSRPFEAILKLWHKVFHD
jgi:glutamate-ammonia-ligase adenylyltransferase